MSADLKKKMTDPKHHANNPTMLFTIGVGLGALSCFSRADYNLPFFAFLAIMWDSDDNEKAKIRFLLLLTTFVDILWLMFWVPYYHDAEMVKWNYGLHMFVVVVSILEIFLKFAIFLVLFKVNPDNS